jgi:hypothetical protein
MSLARRSVLPFVMLGLLSGACDRDVAPASPTDPGGVPTVTETFTETLVRTGEKVHPFRVDQRGIVEVQLKTVEPLSTMMLGVQVGNWNGQFCIGTIASNDASRVGSPALRGVAEVGDYCVRMRDSGNIPDGVTVTYVIDVRHP